MEVPREGADVSERVRLAPGELGILGRRRAEEGRAAGRVPSGLAVGAVGYSQTAVVLPAGGTWSFSAYSLRSGSHSSMLPRLPGGNTHEAHTMRCTGARDCGSILQER